MLGKKQMKLESVYVEWSSNSALGGAVTAKEPRSQTLPFNRVSGFRV